MHVRLTCLAAVAAMILCAAQARAQERVALVIGNGAYVHAAKLATPANDASDVAEALGKIGFDVTVATDLDRAGMEQRLQQLAGKLANAKVALVYYSGLGLQIGDTSHLVPVDAKLSDDADVAQYTVALPAVLQAMAGRERISVVLVDASRDNPLPQRPAARPSAPTGGAPADPSLGTLIGFSTAPGSVVRDAQGRNSPYAAALIKHLATPGTTINALMRRVRDDVSAATGGRQVPWEHSTLTAEVVLVPASAPAR